MSDTETNTLIYGVPIFKNYLKCILIQTEALLCYNEKSMI